jgi:hypothetical protein
MSLTPDSLKPGDQMILVQTFKLSDHIHQHIEYVLTKYELGNELLLLTHGYLVSLDHNTYETRINGIGMLFANTKLAKKKFESAWDKYVARYDWDPEVEAIPVLKSNHINGYLVEHTKSSAKDMAIIALSPPAKFKEEFNWIMSNTTGKVWWNKLFWLFANDADAALFKLQK